VAIVNKLNAKCYKYFLTSNKLISLIGCITKRKLLFIMTLCGERKLNPQLPKRHLFYM